MSLSTPTGLKQSKQLTWIGLFVFLFGSAFAFVGWYSIQKEGEYKAHGVKTLGKIVGKNIEESWETDSETKRRTKRTSYYVQYEFQPEKAGPVNSKASVSSDFYNSANNNDQIDIQYLPENVSQSRIAGTDDYAAGYIFGGVGTLILIIGISIITYDVKKRSLYRRLLTEGMLVEATIDSVGPGNLSINDVAQWRIAYSFRDMRGQEREGLSQHFAPEKINHLKVGATTKVRYDKDNSTLSIWVGEG